MTTSSGATTITVGDRMAVNPILIRPDASLTEAARLPAPEVVPHV